MAQPSRTAKPDQPPRARVPSTRTAAESAAQRSTAGWSSHDTRTPYFVSIGRGLSPAPGGSTGPENSGRSEGLKLKRFLVQLVGIGLITVVLGEVSIRVVLGGHPLSTGSSVWDHHPTRGWAHRAGATDRFVRLGFEQPIEINSRGLREREIPYERAGDTTRVLVIGDSGVVSFEVAPEDVFTRVMEREFAARGLDVEVINAGCRGYGTDQSLLFLREEGINYRPDLVLYRWSGNDSDDNLTIHKPFRRFGKSYFALGASGELELRGTPVPVFEYAEGVKVASDGSIERFAADKGMRVRRFLRDYLAGRSAFATSLLQLLTAAPAVLSVIQREASKPSRIEWRAPGPDGLAFRLASALVGEMERTSRKAGADFLLIGPGGDWKTRLNEDRGLLDLGAWELYRGRVPEGETTTVPFDPHQNELGHQLFGAALVDRLLEERVIGSP